MRRIVPVLLLAAAPAIGQQLEPRAYSPNPTGAHFALVGYTYQSGDVIFDPSLPFTDVSAKINAAVAGYAQTFGVFGRSANVAISIPYVWGSVEGNVMEDFRKIHRSGLGDLYVKGAVNLLGGPALPLKEFLARTPETTLGMSLTVIAPTGQYSSERLINIGTNRWAFKPELGVSLPAGKWTFEAYAGVWFFTTNPDFFGGTTRTQDPLGVVQAHVGYNFTRALWIALDGTYYWGGRTYSNGVPGDTRLENSRVGATFVFPIARSQAIKLAYSRGATARIGADFQTIAFAYQLLWF
jgi:hypothetical protein